MLLFFTCQGVVDVEFKFSHRQHVESARKVFVLSQIVVLQSDHREVAFRVPIYVEFNLRAGDACERDQSDSSAHISIGMGSRTSVGVVADEVDDGGAVHQQL